MSGPAPGSLGLELGLSSSAHGGDSLTSPEFKVTFGDKATARNANAGGAGSTILSGVVRDVAVGLVVALAARFAWEQFK